MEDYETLRMSGRRVQQLCGNPKPGPEADPSRGNLSPRIIYTLHGLSILLSVFTLGVLVMLMTRVLSETKRSGADIPMDHSSVRAVGLSEEMNRSLAELHAGISQINNLAVTLAKTVIEVAELRAEITKLKENSSPVQITDQWKLFNRRLYYFSSGKKEWGEAEEVCAIMKAKLLVINSNLEQTFIGRNLNSYSWIGLHDTAVEGYWRWVDGTYYGSNVKFWGTNQPDQQQDEDCALMHPDDGSWHDWPCSSIHSFICEKPEQ